MVKKILNVLLIILLFFGATIPVFASAADLQAWFESGTTKIQQTVVPKDQPTWSIQAARNEFEPFQLVLKKNSTDSNNVDVSISDFTGPSGTISSSNVTIFKEHYLNITQVGTTGAQPGYWPDALLPKVDAYYHETRTGVFPTTIPAGWVQPFWFDVFVPAAANPGSYTATVTVTENSAPIFTGTVTLTVWNFVLPATSSFPSYFGMNYNSLWKGFLGTTFPTQAQAVNFQRNFIRAGLRHRISGEPQYLQYGTWNPTTKTYSSFAATRFQASLAGYIDGTSGGIEYGAARLTGFNHNLSSLYQKYVISSGNFAKFCYVGGPTTPPQEWVDEFTERVRLIAANFTPEQKASYYFLVLDEPGAGEVGCGIDNPTLDYNTSVIGAQILKSYGLRTRVTKKMIPELLNRANTPPTNDYFDIWNAPFRTLVGTDVNGADINNLASYAQMQSEGGKLWWYTGCGSGGSCSGVGASWFNRYPQYFIEYPAMSARIFPWMAFKYGIQGEMYYDTVHGFGADSGYSGDPFYSEWSKTYHKNGDGAFFYPGVANLAANSLPGPLTNGACVEGTCRGIHTPQLGGTHDIPIESIRLKMLREGREDYEYLKMLSDRGDDAWAQSVVNNLVTNTYTWNNSESDLYAVRSALANRIAVSLGAADTTAPSVPSGLRVN